MKKCYVGLVVMVFVMLFLASCSKKETTVNSASSAPKEAPMNKTEKEIKPILTNKELANKILEDIKKAKQLLEELQTKWDKDKWAEVYASNASIRKEIEEDLAETLKEEADQDNANIVLRGLRARQANLSANISMVEAQARYRGNL